MIDLSKYRIIDLSVELLPGERKIDGRYLHGEPLWGRPVEVQEFIAYGARMHFIQSQTHSSTHVEAPYKYSETGADVGSMPVESYMGEAVACNFTHKKAGEAITPEELQRFGVKKGDIVLAWGSPELAGNPPYMTMETIDWFIETKIKMLGIEDMRYSPAGTPVGLGDGDAKLLLAGITMLDAPQGLNRIRKPRVFLIALPPKLRRITASWVRAIVLEEK